jgi:hypothetical protein
MTDALEPTMPARHYQNDPGPLATRDPREFDPGLPALPE